MFYFELAEQFGCPVSVLLENISSKELTEWMAFYKIKEQEHKREMNKVGNKNKPERKAVF